VRCRSGRQLTGSGHGGRRHVEPVSSSRRAGSAGDKRRVPGLVMLRCRELGGEPGGSAPGRASWVISGPPRLSGTPIVRARGGKGVSAGWLRDPGVPGPARCQSATDGEHGRVRVGFYAAARKLARGLLAGTVGRLRVPQGVSPDAVPLAAESASVARGSGQREIAVLAGNSRSLACPCFSC
jgi:hypothetical protein